MCSGVMRISAHANTAGNVSGAQRNAGGKSQLVMA